MNRLRAYRKRSGMNAEKLAELVGTGAQVIYAWERGNHTPRKETQDKLAALLGVKREDIFDALPTFGPKSRRPPKPKPTKCVWCGNSNIADIRVVNAGQDGRSYCSFGCLEEYIRTREA